MEPEVRVERLLRLAALHRQAFPRRALDGVGSLGLQVLLALAAEPEQQTGQLAQRLRVDQSSVSQAVLGLTRRRFVRARRTTLDLRLNHLALTAAGRDAVNTYVDSLDPEVAQALGGL